MKSVMFLACICGLIFSLGTVQGKEVNHLGKARVPSEDSSFQENPLHCTNSGKSRSGCVKHHRCVWCEGEGLPGACFSEWQEKALIHKLPYVKCFTKQQEERLIFLLRGSTENKGLEQGEGTSVSANDPYDPKCLNAPSDADDNPAEICDSTADSKGGMCVWCDAAGVFGLCLSHDQAIQASAYLQCDLGDYP